MDYKELTKNIVALISLNIEHIKEPRVTIGVKDLMMLVKFAVKHEEITLSRASELTGIGLEYWRTHYPPEADVILPEE